MKPLEDWLLRTLGSVLGLAAIGCGGAPAYGTGAEYGMPHATYHLGGTVTDMSTGTPVPGVQVTFQNQNVFSRQDGTFSIDATVYPCTTCSAKAADVDGNLNGSYQDKEVPLTLVKILPGSGNWDMGTYEQKNLAIRLDPKP